MFTGTSLGESMINPLMDSDDEDGSLFDAASEGSEWIESSLCVHCRYLCDNIPVAIEDPDPSYKTPHWNDVLQLADSAASGCTMCAQFLQSLSSEELEEVQTMTRKMRAAVNQKGVSYSEMYESGDIRVNLLFASSSNSDGHDVTMEGYAPENLVLRVDLIPHHSLGTSSEANDTEEPGPSRALRLVCKWLERCRKSHWQCKSARGEYKPTRLLAISDNNIRLIHRNDLQDTPEYATLSHCWGETQLTTLTKHTYNTFKTWIPEEAIPKTFRDAITITRHVGLDYLWIDSLCIVQDDPDDWAREAASMSSIYGSSSLNIAASGAPNGTFGCFSQIGRLIQCHVALHFEGHPVPYRCLPADLLDRSLTNMPLMGRGWALQERILAPRNAHFTFTQVFWECHQKVACETFPDELPLSLRDSDAYRDKQPVSRSMWDWIVERYARSALSHSADKLVAISGLARAIQAQTGDQYVAGMWRRDLEFQLCWYKNVTRACKRVVPYRAPTWSWASLDCFIQYSHQLSTASSRKPRLWVRVLNVDIVSSKNDSLGQLGSASLRLGCMRLLHITFGYELGNEDASSEGYIAVGSLRIEVSIRLDEEDCQIKQRGIALPISGDADDGRIWGLLLEATGQAKGQFRRLGAFCTLRSEDCSTFEAACDDPSSWLDSSQLVKIRRDKFGDSHRIITVV